MKEKFLIMRSVTLSGLFEVLCYKICKNRIKKLTLPDGFLKSNISHKIGLELGGPSRLFNDKGIIPLYNSVKAIDNVNYSTSTIWNEQESHRMVAFRKTIISEASDLVGIESDSYDFVVSSNVLEHLSNPLRALLEMKRVVHTGASLL